MEFQVQVAHSVQEVGREAWDRLSKNRPFASYRWYRFGETVMADNLPVYVILSQGKEAIARATFWLRRNEPIPVSSAMVRRLIEALLRRRPLLICQAPLVGASGLILPEPPLRDDALRTIARIARDQARKLRASFVAFVYLEEQEARLPGWPDAFGAVDLPDPGTRLDVVWPDFDGYLQSLSKKSRRQYRTNCRNAVQQGIEVSCQSLATGLDADVQEQALAMVRDVERHYGSPPDPWARGMYEQAGMVDSAWLAARIEGRLVACSLLVGDGGIWRWALLGRQYDVEYAYFQLAYEAIRHVVETRGQVLFGGTHSYETKRRLGFELTTDTWARFIGNGPLFQGLGHWADSFEESQGVD
jgi:predicted N-acyltransferase